MQRRRKKMEGEGVLLAATPQRLLLIDITKLKINPYSELPPLPVFKVVNLVEEELPIGMHFFVRDSKLYMVGGKKPRVGLLPEMLRDRKKLLLDESFGYRGISPHVYVSDLTGGLDSITLLRKHPISMLAAKPTPIVTEIGGKIYVLLKTPWHRHRELPTPTFEVYDPSSDRQQWEALPEPPFRGAAFYASSPFDVAGHSVVGTTLYVLAWSLCGDGEFYFSYNVNDKIWKFLGKSVDEVPVPYPLRPLFSGKFVPAYDDIFIYFQFQHLGAAWIPSDGSPTRYQVLTEVYGDYYLRDGYPQSGLVVELGEHEMCIMMPFLTAPDIPLEQLSDDIFNPTPLRSILYMATFRVEKLNSSDQACPPKLHKTDDASDVSQTSHHDNGNCHYRHLGYLKLLFSIVFNR